MYATCISRLCGLYYVCQRDDDARYSQWTLSITLSRLFRLHSMLFLFVLQNIPRHWHFRLKICLSLKFNKVYYFFVVHLSISSSTPNSIQFVRVCWYWIFSIFQPANLFVGLVGLYWLCVQCLLVLMLWCSKHDFRRRTNRCFGWAMVITMVLLWHWHWILEGHRMWRWWFPHTHFLVYFRLSRSACSSTISYDFLAAISLSCCWIYITRKWY